MVCTLGPNEYKLIKRVEFSDSTPNSQVVVKERKKLYLKKEVKSPNRKGYPAAFLIPYHRRHYSDHHRCDLGDH